MEWNARSTLPWDWDNLVMFNVKADGEIENGSFHSYGGGGGSGSDLGHGSSSKGSINSSLKGEMKTSKFTLETSEGSPIEFSKRKELAVLEVSGTSPTLEASIGSGEHLLGLKLGKRTYFEDVCAGTSAKPSYFSAVPTSSSIMAKRARASCQSTQALRCQVEGCNLDLTLAKDYHRRHRVCESHSKCTKVIVAGLERRFCQQCSRFHALSEFDENKRSCRKRLSEHNARRRKPPPEAIHFKSTMLSPSLCDGKQQMNLVFNRLPFVHTMPAVNPMWESTCSPKFKQTKGSLLWPEKAGIDGQLHLPSDELTNAITTRHHDPHRLLPSKGTTAEVLNKDLEASVITSSLDATSDLRRALSLLSTNSWGSDEPELTSLDRLMHVNYSKMDQPVLHAVSHGLPLATSEYWQAEQQSVDSQVHSVVSNGNGSSQFQGFQLFKAPSEPGFFFQ